MRISEFLDRADVKYQYDEHPEAMTAGQLAAVERVSRHNVIKPVMVEADGEMLMCAVPGDRRIDLESLRQALHAGYVRMIEEREIGKICSDCELGAEPPIGKLYGLRTVMDESLRDDDRVVFQAGTHRTAIWMDERDFEKIADPQVARFART